jgi:hypothetical protein
VDVHAKLRLTLVSLRALRSEGKGQAEACPDRTRAIPCTLPAVTPAVSDSNGDSNSSSQRQASAVGSTPETHVRLHSNLGMPALKSGRLRG